MLGFAGAHRSGKTTTAQAVCKRLGLDFFDGSFGKAAAHLGYNSVDAMSVEARIEMQEKVLSFHLACIKALPRPMVTDRTPLDYIGYALADVAMHPELPAEIGRRIAAYVENCLFVTEQHYGAIAILRPLPVYVPEPGKPSPCPAYQSHIQMIVEGAAWRAMIGGVTVSHITTNDLEQRIETVAGFFADHIGDLQHERNAQVIH